MMRSAAIQNNRKLLLLRTWIFNIFFLSVEYRTRSLMKMHAIVFISRQMQPSMRYVQAGPMFLFNGVTISGKTSPPIPEPLAIIPRASPLLFVNHCGAIERAGVYIIAVSTNAKKNTLRKVQVPYLL